MSRALFIALICLTVSALAQETVYWRNGAGVANWWDGANPWYRNCDGYWVDRPDRNQCSTYPGSTGPNYIHFDNGSDLTMTINGAYFQVLQLLFDDGTGARTMTADGSGGLDMRSGGSTTKIENNDADTQVLKTPVVLYTGTQINPVQGDLTFHNPIYLKGNWIDVYGDNRKTLNLYGVLDRDGGDGGLAVKQHSFVNVTNNNTMTGAIVIEKGVVRLAGSTNAMGASGIINVGTNATLELNENVTWRPVVQLNLFGNGTNGVGGLRKLTSSGSMTWPGSVGFSNSTAIAVDGGDLTVTGLVSGTARWSKLGSGTLVFNGSNTYSGATIISNGVLIASHQRALGVSTVQVEQTATLILTNFSGNTMAVTFTNPVVGGGNVQIAPANNVEVSVGGNWEGFTGTVRVSSGGGNSKMTAVFMTNSPPTNSTIIISNGATFYANVNTFSNRFIVTGTGNGEGRGALRLDGATIVGPIVLTNAGSPSVSIGNGDTANPAVLKNTISEASPLMNLVKAGTGSGDLTINGTNTYSGITSNTQGRLNLGSTNAIGTNTLAMGGTSSLDNSSGAAMTIPNPLNINAGFTFAGSSSMTMNGAVSMGSANRTITVSANTFQWNGVVSSSGDRNLTVTGPGTLVMTNANTFSGQLIVNGGGTAVVTSIKNVGGGNSAAGNPASAALGVIQLGATTQSGSLKYTGAGDTSDRTIDLAGTTGGATLDASGSGAITFSAAAFTVSGSGAKTLTLQGTNTGTNTISGVISNSANGTVALTKVGSGTWVLGGLNTYSNATRANAGTLVLSGGHVHSGSADTLSINNVGAQNAILKITGGLNGFYDMPIAEAASSSGAVWQTGGNLTLNRAAGVDVFKLGSGSSSYGYYALSGGSVTSTEFGVGYNSGAVGVMDVLGGTMTTPSGWITLARNGGTASGLLNVYSGSVTFGTKLAINWGGTAGSISVVNVGGGPDAATITGPASTANGLDLASANVAGTFGIMNVLRNGTLAVGVITAGNGNPTALLNLNGGTLMATIANSGWITNGNIDGIYVYTNGVTIDDNGVSEVWISRPILAPTGYGLNSLTLASGGSGYIGAPMITISGGSGVGATAIAQMDLAGGTVTNILITNPGSGYGASDSLTITVSGGGGSGLAFSATNLIANSSTGRIVKIGSGILKLQNNGNTYGGGTIVSNGSLWAEQNNALGTGRLTLHNGTFGYWNALTITNDVMIDAGTTNQFQGEGNYAITMSGALMGGGYLSVTSLYSASVWANWAGNVSNFTGTIEHRADSKLAFGFTGASDKDLSQARVITVGPQFSYSRFGFTDNQTVSATLKIGELSGNGVLASSWTGNNKIYTFEVGALNTTSTFSGLIYDETSSKAALTKVGTGMLILSSTNNAYSGGTVVSNGTLRVVNGIGSASGSGLLLVTASGRLDGTGRVSSLRVENGGRLAPGLSPGTLTAGDTTWNTNGIYEWEINDFTGTLGSDPGWDYFKCTGSLTIAATTDNAFTVRVASLTYGNVSGIASNFDASGSFTQIIASAVSISGYATNVFFVDTTGFSNAFTGGWTTRLINNTNIALVYYQAANVNVYGNNTLIPDDSTAPSLANHTDFGDVLVDGATLTRTYTITNVGTSAVGIGNVTTSGAAAVEFIVVSQPSSLLNVGESTTFQVQFNPTNAGTRTATVLFTNTTVTKPTYDFVVQGTGTYVEIDVSGNGNSIASGDATPSLTDHTDFGNVGVQTATVTRTFTITNTGNRAASLGTVSLAGTGAGDFTVTVQPSGTLNPSNSTTFNIVFDPSVSGLRTAVVSFTTTDDSFGDGLTENPYTFTIQGMGQTAFITNSPATLAAAVMAGNGNPSALSFAVTNGGLGYLSYTISTQAHWMTVSPVAGSLAAGAGQPHTVSFSVSGVTVGTTSNSTITVTDGNASNSPQTVAVSLTVSNVPSPTAVTATPSGAEFVRLTWTESSGRPVLIVFRQTNAPSADPVNGTGYTLGSSIGGGVVMYSGTVSSLDHVVQPGSTNFYAFYTINSNYYSPVVLAGATVGVYRVGEIVEPFSYTNGLTISSSRNGGNGWTNAWTAGFGTFTVVTDQFAAVANYPAVAGNSITGNNASIYREFAAVTTGKIFAAFMMRTDNGGGSQYSGLSFFDNGSEKKFFGEGFSQVNQLTVGSTTGPSGRQLANNTDYTIVAMYDFESDVARAVLYTNGTESVPMTEPSSWHVSESDASISRINRVRLESNVGTKWDEVRIAKSWNALFDRVPPSATNYTVKSGVSVTDGEIVSGQYSITMTFYDGVGLSNNATYPNYDVLNPSSVQITTDRTFAATSFSDAGRLLYGSNSTQNASGTNVVELGTYTLRWSAVNSNGVPTIDSTTLSNGTAMTFTVVDDDTDAPVFDSALDGGAFQFLIKTTNYYYSGSGTANVARVTDGDLAAVSAANPMKFIFNVYDASGVARGNSGSAADVLNFDIGGVGTLQDIFATYSNGLSTASATVSSATSVYYHATAFTSAELNSLVAARTNVVAVSAPDMDMDRNTDDRSKVINAQIGIFEVLDDDVDAPVIGAPAYLTAVEEAASLVVTVSISDATSATLGSSVTLYYGYSAPYNANSVARDGATDGNATYTFTIPPQTGRITQVMRFYVVAADNDMDRTGDQMWSTNNNAGAYFAVTITPARVIYDQFNYSAGSLAGSAGLAGWTSSWQNVSGANALGVNASSLGVNKCYPTEANNKAQGNVGSGPASAKGRRYFPAITNGVVYASYVMNFQYGNSFGSLNKFAGMSFMEGTTERAFFGALDDNATPNVLILGADIGGKKLSTYQMSEGNVNYQIFAKYDFAAQTFYVKTWKVSDGFILNAEFVANTNLQNGWNKVITGVSISRIDGIQLGLGADSGGPGEVNFDEIRIGTNWYETMICGGLEDMDREGPMPTLVYIGTNYANDYNNSLVIPKTTIYDNELSDSGNPVDIAVMWTDPSGVFVTNNPSSVTNIGAEAGRVWPNWDPLAVGAATNDFGLDRIFEGAYGYNGATAVTTYQYNAFSITNLQAGITYFLTVSAEDNDTSSPCTATGSAGGLPAPCSRAITVNSNLAFTVLDDDVIAPTVTSFVVYGAYGAGVLSATELASGGWSVTGLVQDTGSGINNNGSVVSDPTNNISPSFTIYNSTGTAIIVSQLFTNRPADGGAMSSPEALGNHYVTNLVNIGNLPTGVYTVRVTVADNDEDRGTQDHAVLTNGFATTFYVFNVGDGLVWDATNAVSGIQDGVGNWNLESNNWYVSVADINVPWNNNVREKAIFGQGGAGAYTVSVGTAYAFAGALEFRSNAFYQIGGTGLLTFGQSAGTVHVSAARAAIAANLATGTLVKTGTGDLHLLSANSYRGGTFVNDGRLIISNANALGIGTTARVASAGTLILGVGNTTIGNVFDGPGTLVANALGTGANSLLITNSSPTFSGTWNVGTGGGKMNLDYPVDGSAVINVLNGGTVYLSAGRVFSNTFTLAGGTLGESLGQLRIENGTIIRGGIVLSNNTSIGGNNAPSNIIDGAISEAGGTRTLTKQGTTTILIRNTNTFSGTFTLSSGAVLLGSTNSIGTNTLIIGGASAFDNYSGGAMTILNGLTMSGGSPTYNGTADLTMNGPVLISAANRTITVSNNTLQLNGGIAESGSRSLTKAGAGQLILTNSAAHSGGTVVSAGRLSIAHDSALGLGKLSLNGGVIQAYTTARTVANSASLDASSEIGGALDFTIGGGFTNAGGSRTLTVTNQAMTKISGPVFLSDTETSGRTVTWAVSSGSTVMLMNAVANNNAGNATAANLLKSNPGRMMVYGTNTYSGTTTVSGGDLQVLAGAISNAAAITVGNTAGSVASLSVSNGGKIYSGAWSMGTAAGASNNLIYVGGPGAAVTVSNAGVNVGSAANANSNTLFATNANVFCSGDLYSGANGGATGALFSLMGDVVWNMSGIRTVRVSGPQGVIQVSGGSVLTNFANLWIGNGVNGGLLQVSSGGKLYQVNNAAYDAEMGRDAGCSSNRIIVTDSGSLWNAGARDIRIGGGAGSGADRIGNQLIITAGGVVTNAGTVYFADSGAGWSNELYVSDGGQLYATTINIGQNASGSNNTFYVGGGGAASTVRVGAINVGPNGSKNNRIIVSNATLFSSGQVMVGGAAAGADSNSAYVGSGAYWDCGAQQFGSRGSGGNAITITDGAIVTNTGNFILGDNGSARDHVMTVSGGAKLYTGQGGTIWAIGFNAGAKSNLMTVTDPGTLWNAGGRQISIGADDTSFDANTGNTLRITSGAIFTNGSFNVGGQVDNRFSVLDINAATAYVAFLYIPYPTHQAFITNGSYVEATSDLHIGAGNLRLENSTFRTSRSTAPAVLIGSAANLTSTVDMTSGTLIASAGELWISSAAGSHGVFNMSGGDVVVNNYSVMGRGGQDGVLNMSGGSWSNRAGHFIMGSFAGNTGSVAMTGGIIYSTNDVWVGETGNGTFSLGGTGVLKVDGTLQVARNAGAVGRFTMSGGSVWADGFSTGSGTPTINISGGTLGTYNANGTWSASATLSNVVTVQATDEGGTSRDITQTGVWSGPGQVNKTGAGALIMAAASTYVGGTIVSNGTLRATHFAASATGTGLVDMASGATLDGTGAVANVVVRNGGIVSPGNGALGTLTVTNRISWSSAGTYRFEISDFEGAYGASSIGWDKLNVRSALSIDATTGTFTVRVVSLTHNGVSGLASNFDDGADFTIPIASAPIAGAISGFSSDKFVVDASAFSNAFSGVWSVLQDGSNVVLQFTSTNAPDGVIWDATNTVAEAQDGDGTWNTTPNKNWWHGSGNSFWNNTSARRALFGVGGGGSYTVSVSSAVTAGGIHFRTGAVYEVGSGAGTATIVNGKTVTVDAASARLTATVTGGGWTKDGTGTLFVAAANSFTNFLTIAGGAWVAQTNKAFGGAAVTVLPGAALTVTNVNGNGANFNGLSETITNAIAGGGVINVTPRNGQEITFSGAMTGFTNVINVYNSGGASKMDITNALVSLPSVATISVSNGATFYGAGVAHSNQFRVMGSGNTENFGAIRLDSGNIQGNISLLSDITIGGNGTAFPRISGNISDGGSGFGFSRGSASSAGNLLTLAGTNTYSGGTTIGAGKVILANTVAITNSTVTVSTSQGLLFTNDTAFTIGGIAGSSGFGLTNMNGGVVELTVGNNNADATYSGIMSAGGSLVKIGSGAQTLSGINTYTGLTTIKNGKIIISGGNNRIPVANAMVLGDGASGSGKLQIGDSGAARSQTLASLETSGSGVSNRVVGGNASVSTFTWDSTITNTFAGMFGGPAANEDSLAVTKSGEGAFILTGSNSYVGTTTINTGGMLRFVANAGNTIGGVSYAMSTGSVLQLNRGMVLSLASDNDATFWPSGINNLPNDATAGSDVSQFSFEVVGLSTAMNKRLTLSGNLTFTPTSGNRGNDINHIYVQGSNEYTLVLGDVTAANNGQVGGQIHHWYVGPDVNLSLNSYTQPGGAPESIFWIDGEGDLDVRTNIHRATNRSLTINKSGTGAFSINGGTTDGGGSNAYTFNLTNGTINVNHITALRSTINIVAGALGNTCGSDISLTTSPGQNWYGDFAFNGTNNLNLGTGAVTMNTNITITTLANTLTVGGTITETGGTLFNFVKKGPGTLTLSGTKTFTGLTTVNNGILNVAGNHTANNQYFIGSNTADNATLNISNGTVVVDAPGSPVNAFSVGYGDDSTGVVNMVAGTLVSADELWISAGTRSLGIFNLSGGNVIASNWTAVGRHYLGGGGRGANGYLNISGGSWSNRVNNNFTTASFDGSTGRVYLTGGTLYADHNINIGERGVASITNAGGVLVANDAVQLAVLAGSTGSLFMSAGELWADSMTVGSGAGYSVELSGGFYGAVDTANVTWSPNIKLSSSPGAGTATFLGQDRFGSLANLTLTGVLSGNGALAKAGAGALTLHAHSTYTGSSTVSNGTLVVNGSVSNSATLVRPSAILGGTGTVGSITIQAAGIVSAGRTNSIGTLAATGSMTVTNGSRIVWNCTNATGIAGRDWDVIRLQGGSGALSLDSSAASQLVIQVIGPIANFSSSLADTGEWVVVDAGGVNGFDVSKVRVDMSQAGSAVAQDGVLSARTNVAGDLVLRFQYYPPWTTNMIAYGFGTNLVYDGLMTNGNYSLVMKIEAGSGPLVTSTSANFDVINPLPVTIATDVTFVAQAYESARVLLASNTPMPSVNWTVNQTGIHVVAFSASDSNLVATTDDYGGTYNRIIGQGGGSWFTEWVSQTNYIYMGAATSGVNHITRAAEVMSNSLWWSARTTATFRVMDFNGQGGLFGMNFPGASTNVPFAGTDGWVMQGWGKIYVRQAGDITFGARSDDGLQLWVDGSVVIAEGSGHGVEDRYGSVNLSVGLHDVRFLTYDWFGNDGSELFVAKDLGVYTNFTGDGAPESGWELLQPINNFFVLDDDETPPAVTNLEYAGISTFRPFWIASNFTSWGASDTLPQAGGNRISGTDVNQEWGITDGELAEIGTRGFRFVFAGYDAASGISRGTTGTTNTVMSFSIDSVPYSGDYSNFNASLSAPDGANRRLTNVWTFADGTFGPDIINSLVTNSAVAIRVTMPDSDVDRSNDQSVTYSRQVSMLRVVDDDTDAYPVRQLMFRSNLATHVATGFENLEGWTNSFGYTTQEVFAAGAQWFVNNIAANTLNERETKKSQFRKLQFRADDSWLVFPTNAEIGSVFAWMRNSSGAQTNRFVAEYSTNSTDWIGIGVTNLISSTNFVMISWHVGIETTASVRIRATVVNSTAVYCDDVSMTRLLPWTNGAAGTNFSLAWSNPTADVSGIHQYWYTNAAPTVPDAISNGVVAATNGVTFVSTAQGVITGFVYAVDNDNDRPGDRTKGMSVPYTPRVDLTPPPRVTGLFGSNTNPVLDDTSEIELSWTGFCANAGNRFDPSDPPGGTPLSPWHSYIVYYTDATNGPTTNDAYITFDNGPLSLKTNTTTSVILSNFISGADYRLAIAGMDKAGNIGAFSETVVVQVANFVVTQGLVSATSSNRVELSWTARGDSTGYVSRVFDVIYFDSRSGFANNTTNLWTFMSRVTNSWALDTGAVARISPYQLTSTMRFYRAAVENAWTTNQPVRRASQQIYVSKAYKLVPGENWLSLFAVPDTNTVASVFGTNRLPGSGVITNATRISWYGGATSNGQPKTTIYLSASNRWIYSLGGAGVADDMEVPLNEGFNIELPLTVTSQHLIVIGELPTNTLTQPVVASTNFNILSYTLPRRVRVKDLDLRNAGFRAGTNALHVLQSADELRILNNANGNGAMTSPRLAVWFQKIGAATGNFYRVGGTTLANDEFIEVDETIIWYRRGSSNTTWTNDPTRFYSVPGKTMNP